MASAAILKHHLSKENSVKEWSPLWPPGQPSLTVGLSVLRLVYTSDEQREDLEFRCKTFQWRLGNHENWIERGDCKLERTEVYSLPRRAELEKEETSSVGPGWR